MDNNFSFLEREWPEISETATHSEYYVQSDPRSACFYARRALEQSVNWLFDHDRAFSRPYDNNLSTLLSDNSFRKNVPDQVENKAQFIRKLGNVAVHTDRKISPMESLAVVKELYHVLFWLARTYTRGDPVSIPTQFDESLLPPSEKQLKTQSAAQLQKLAEELKARDEALQKQLEQVATYQQQLAGLQAQVAKSKQANAKVEVHHVYTEAQTRELLIDMLLREAGWDPKGENVEEYPVKGMPNVHDAGYVDYVLWGDDGLPLALVEAKRTTSDPKKGRQQAKLYADCLEQMHGRRPVIFYTNGYQSWLWDDTRYPPRPVQGFYTKDELERLIQRRTSAAKLSEVPVNKNIVDRYYQEEGIRAMTERLEQKYRKGLLVMATGTGKTRVVIALVDLLMRANWVKRVLFLADRTSLVRQAVNAFKKNLPESNPINLVENKEAAESRVVVSTYQTMLGQIDSARKEDAGSEVEKLFGPGHFDLVIIDEAHRSVYLKFGAIFEYFDSMLVGLTATPKDDVDRNTYRLFELEDGVPTYNYGLERAVTDGFLVPPRAMSVPLKFQREGIKYDDLSDEEKVEWELIDWDEDGNIPEKISSAALNAWLFNQDTVDKVLKHLMENGLKVAGGDRLGKTIIFAKGHNHAMFIEERFDANYPHLAGQFARVIDNQQTYAQSLIDDFSKVESDPHIAISVDMLDTGIDIPEVVNLVFFKLVRSKTKFVQMLGRGTRLRPDLFGPGEDKNCFVVFDYCQNFEFFNENPQGFDARAQEPLSQQLFKRRLELLEQYNKLQSNDTEMMQLANELAGMLHGQVAAMNVDNFIVRPKRAYIDQFAKRGRWNKLSKSDLADLAQHVSGLPVEKEEEEETAKRFDLLILQMQLAQMEGAPKFEKLRDRVIGLAEQLEGKTTIPMVHAQLALIKEIQTDLYWAGVTPRKLEVLRMALRDLMQFVDREGQKVIYTDFTDELGEMKEAPGIYYTNGVNLNQYRKKVYAYIHEHLNHKVIQKIRHAQPLDFKDLKQLEEFLFSASEVGSRETFENAYGKQENLGLFIRRLVGLDRKAAKDAFAKYLDGKTFTADQIRFINYIIDHLTANGVMDEGLLYDQPFTDINDMGLDGVFPGMESDLLEIIRRINQTANP